jgi:hypothetical protein
METVSTSSLWASSRDEISDSSFLSPLTPSQILPSQLSHNHLVRGDSVTAKIKERRTLLNERATRGDTPNGDPESQIVLTPEESSSNVPGFYRVVDERPSARLPLSSQRTQTS